VSVRITPACSNSASTLTSEAPSSSRMRLDGAPSPAAGRPLLTAMIGFDAPSRRAIVPNRRGLPNDSRYSSTTRVASSPSQYWRKSLLDRSALSPVETNDESPMPRAAAAAIEATPIAPLWEASATGPWTGAVGAAVAFSRSAGSVLRTPSELGPTSRMPLRRQIASSWASRAFPSSPPSRKPPDRTTSARTPAAPHARACSSTSSGATASSARSTAGSSRSADAGEVTATCSSPV
jgi:hypothetical protein